MGFDSNIGRNDLGASWKDSDVEPRHGFTDPEKDPEGNFLVWHKGDAIICDRYTYNGGCRGVDGSLAEYGYMASPRRLLPNAPLGQLLISGFGTTEGIYSTSGVYEGFVPNGSVTGRNAGQEVITPIRGKLARGQTLHSEDLDPIEYPGGQKWFYIVENSYTNYLTDGVDLVDWEHDLTIPEFVVGHDMWRYSNQIQRASIQFVVPVSNCVASGCNTAYVVYFLARIFPPDAQQPPFFIDSLYSEQKTWKIRVEDPHYNGSYKTYGDPIHEGTVDEFGELVGVPDIYAVAEDTGPGYAPYRLEVCCNDLCPPIDMDVVGTVWIQQIINDTYPRRDRLP